MNPTKLGNEPEPTFIERAEVIAAAECAADQLLDPVYDTIRTLDLPDEIRAALRTKLVGEWLVAYGKEHSDPEAVSIGEGRIKAAEAAFTHYNEQSNEPHIAASPPVDIGTNSTPDYPRAA